MLTELLLVAALQVHPCDDVLPVNPSLTSPVVAGFCHEDPTITVRIFVDSKLVWEGTPVQVAGPNTAGFYYFETPTFVPSKGTHTATAQVLTADGPAPLSEGYTFTITSPPGAAKRVRIKGG